MNVFPLCYPSPLFPISTLASLEIQMIEMIEGDQRFKKSIPCLPFALFCGLFESSSSAYCVRALGALERVEWMMFTSSTSCRERRDFGALRAGSDDCWTAGDGASGDSGGGGGSKGKGLKEKLAVVLKSEIPSENPYKCMNSSRKSGAGAPEFKGIGELKVFAGRPYKAGLKMGVNVESSVPGIS